MSAIPARTRAETSTAATIRQDPGVGSGLAGAKPAATGLGCPYPLASIARSFVSSDAGVSIFR